MMLAQAATAKQAPVINNNNANSTAVGGGGGGGTVVNQIVVRNDPPPETVSHCQHFLLLELTCGCWCPCWIGACMGCSCVPKRPCGSFCGCC